MRRWRRCASRGRRVPVRPRQAVLAARCWYSTRAVRRSSSRFCSPEVASVSWEGSASGSVPLRRCCGSSGFRRQRSRNGFPEGLTGLWWPGCWITCPRPATPAVTCSGPVTGWCTAESGSPPRSGWTTPLSPRCARLVTWRRSTTRRIWPASRLCVLSCPTCRKSPCSIPHSTRRCRLTLFATRYPRSGTRGTECGVTGSTASVTASSASRPPPCWTGHVAISGWSPPTWATGAARQRCATACRSTRPWGSPRWMGW